MHNLLTWNTLEIFCTYLIWKVQLIIHALTLNLNFITLMHNNLFLFSFIGKVRQIRQARKNKDSIGFFLASLTNIIN